MCKNLNLIRNYNTLLVKIFIFSCLKMHHFRVILPKLVLTPQKETSSCVFKMTIFSKFFGFHEACNQVKCRLKNKNITKSNFLINVLSIVESGFLRISLYVPSLVSRYCEGYSFWST